MSVNNEDADSGTKVITEDRVQRPKRYKVLLHNDDYTTMEFVVFILVKVFHKSNEIAEQIMLKIHQDGFGICGIYIYEIAETKMQLVNIYAKEQGHPLKCTIEAE